MGLTSAQLDRFAVDGYLVVEGALTAADLDPVIAEYEAHIDRGARQLLAAGRICRLYEEEPFERRLVAICRQCAQEIYGGLDIMHLRGAASFAFLRNGRLLDLVESLVGPEITCNPIQHIRAKLPDGLTPAGGDSHVAAWHQDAAVMLPEADPSFIVTVWLPLADATAQNGCLRVIPRVHGRGLIHRTGSKLAPEELPAVPPVTLPMRKGDVLLLHKETPHSSGPNRSDTVRWSIDLRYQKTGTPTGRPFWPAFVARSRAEPRTVLTDHGQWCHLWERALRDGAGKQAYRWR